MPSHGSTREIRLTHQGRVGAAAKAAPGPSGRTPVGQAAHTQRVAIQAAAPGATVPPHVLAHQHFQNALAALHQVLSAYKSGPSAVRGLNPEQQSVLHTLVNVGNRSGASPSDKLSAIETGIVESNLSNPAGGDGSSVGWRQETSSSYPSVNRMNVGQSAQRFYNELKGAPSGSPGQRAQAVQRSAFPGRYDQAQGEAQQLLKASSPKKPNPKNLRTLAKAGISAPAPSKSKAKKPAAAKRYTNPLPGGQWSQSRTDMGKDFSAPAGAPILALGKGTYLGHGQGADWPGAPASNAGVFYKLKNAKNLPSPYVYFYEGVSGNPKLRPGQKIKKGQLIAESSGGPNGIEAGFATSSGGTLSAAHGTQNHNGDPGAFPTPEGTAFQNLLSKLPGSKVAKGNIVSFVTSGGGGSTGVAGFSSVTGVSASAARKMSPQQRMMALRAALSKTLRAYGGASSVLTSSPSSRSSAPLTHVPNKPAV